ncbi:hypothetical protein P9239_21240 [Caballeronia sp. LZ062]|uniref:hypothetical protein n=1 Tax=unclassified Caballeronia TaxID=2646786 RepID=UPI002857DADA|nr:MULTISPECIES: hypothetical protein [unclassified Caballeronia]MDR5856203.1 hypothetical protein [Caballeronia sp. LZ050]MDR5872874.1 hypothetical protein [Caballeronia sp. LZ062]
MIGMLAACVGAGVAMAIPLCLIGHRKRMQNAPQPRLRLERVVRDTRLVGADGGESGPPDGTA